MPTTEQAIFILYFTLISFTAHHHVSCNLPTESLMI